MKQMLTSDQLKRYNRNCSLEYNNLIRGFLKTHGESAYEFQSFFYQFEHDAHRAEKMAHMIDYVK